MKRTLLVLPLIVLVLGLAALYLRNPKPAPGPESSSPRPPQDPGVQAPLPPSVPPVKTAPAPSPAGTGAIRFMVRLRGKPAPDAKLSVYKLGTEEVMKFTPEADGTQLLHGLAAAEYAINVDQEDSVHFYRAVRVGVGETVQVDIDLKAGGRIMGIVTDRAGRPVPKTRVFLIDEVTKGPPNNLVCYSDDQGQYALKKIPAGAFGVRFRHLEYKPLDRMGLLFRGGAEEYRIDVVLDVGATISGRVVDEANGPIAGADVVAGNVESGNLTKSAKDGSFTITGLTDTPANISAAKPGYGKVVLRNLSGNPTNVVLRLPRAGTIPCRLLIDQVPRQVQVTLSRYDDELKQVIPTDSRFYSPPTTGTFVIEDVHPGTYWMDVQVSEYEPAERPQITVASGQIVNEVSISMRRKN